MDIILDRKCPPKEEAPYNWRELGFIKNVSEEKQKTFCEQPIYQILPIKYLIKILLNGKLHFNKVLKSWEDPYELFLFKENIIIEGQSSNDYFSDYKHGYYGQCWSLIKDTDAMWRIYSHNKEGVRIKTSVGKMIQVLDQTRGYKNIVANFGVVKYLSQADIVKWMFTVVEKGSGYLFDAFTDSLFIKRIEFDHENEMRFLLLTHNLFDDAVKIDIESNFIELDVNPFDFIEEITLDPRLSDEDFNDMKKMLSLLSRDIPINKSNLYEFETMDLSLKESPMHVSVVTDQK